MDRAETVKKLKQMLIFLPFYSGERDALVSAIRELEVSDEGKNPW